jgi:hypothetical protein
MIVPKDYQSKWVDAELERGRLEKQLSKAHIVWMHVRDMIRWYGFPIQDIEASKELSEILADAKGQYAWITKLQQSKH